MTDFQQPRHRLLRVRQVRPVPGHVLGVAADIGNEQDGATDRHETNYFSGLPPFFSNEISH